MKLILGSDLSFLLKYGYNLTGVPKNQMRIGYVNTAAKGLSIEKQQFMEKVKKIIKENGYSFEEIDIEGKNQEELKSFFEDKNVIHVDGGSTTYLLNAIRATGFDKILEELLNKGLVYIGTSAGSMVVGPTIDSSSGTENVPKEKLEALGFVSLVVKSHYVDEKRDEILEKTKNLKYPIRILRDGEGIFCEDGKCKFIGDEEETVLK